MLYYGKYHSFLLADIETGLHAAEYSLYVQAVSANAIKLRGEFPDLGCHYSPHRQHVPDQIHVRLMAQAFVCDV